VGAMAVLFMRLWTLSVESSTVSISERPTGSNQPQVDLSSLPKAA
jgi:hypothetical protein